MKINLAKLSILKAFACSVLIAASVSTAANAQTVTVSRPGNSQYYDYVGNSWNHTANYAYTYNSNGWQLLTVGTHPTTNQNLSKSEYILDSFDKVKTISWFVWQNNGWVQNGGINFIKTHNAANQVTEIVNQVWSNGAFVNQTKTNSTYDAAGNLIETVNSRWKNNAWQYNDRSSYTFVSGTLTERINEIFNLTTASWQPIGKAIYAGWHIPGLRHTSMIMQVPAPSGGWVIQNRSTITMGPNGSYQELNENYLNNTWVNSTRINYTYDAHGNVTDLLTEEFVNGSWRMVWIDEQNFTYNSQNDLLERVVLGQDSTYGPLKNKWKEVYSNFQYFNRTLGTAETSKSQLAVTVYPNPATDKIQIALVDKKDQSFTVTVRDVTGKNWQNQTFKATENKQLDLEALPKGIYLLQIQTETGSIVKRILKQ